MRILILAILLSIPALSQAQHSHFIYIQGENQQLFYVKKSGDLQSSSTTGFLILPKLQPGTHQFSIGFPRDQFPEYEFRVEISGKDRGFTLRNFQEKGWGLFDMQSEEVIMGKRVEAKKEVTRSYGPLSDDPFSVILASVVNDPGIRETSLVQSAVWVSAPATKPAEKQEKGGQPKDMAKTGTKPAPGAKPPVTEPVKDNKPAPGTELAATQKPDKPVSVKSAGTETAKTGEPASKPVEPQVKAQEPPVKTAEPVVKTPEPQVKVEEPVARKTEPVSKPKEPEAKPAGSSTAQKVVKVSELKTWSGYQLTFVDRSLAKPDTIDVIIDDGQVASTGARTEPSAVNTAKLPRTDCKVMAREKDVMNLRKKMLTITDENEMAEVAMKDIRSKCFTVDQLQNLSYLFVTDRGRLSLFEQAYPYIFDPANFQRLEKLLNAEEYLDKFKLIK